MKATWVRLSGSLTVKTEDAAIGVSPRAARTSPVTIITLVDAMKR